MSKPGRSDGARRPGSTFSKITATRNQAATCSRRRKIRAVTPTIPWRFLTIPTVMSTRRAKSHRSRGRRESRQIQARSRAVARPAPFFDRRRSVAASRRTHHARTHPDSDKNREYLVTYCSHTFGSSSYRSGDGDFVGYFGDYEMTPSDRQFRAPLVTHKPEIAGVQSALVVGKEGEEIDVDEQGRICVQFYWDPQEEGVAPSASRAILGRDATRRAILAAHRRRGDGRI